MNYFFAAYRNWRIDQLTNQPIDQNTKLLIREQLISYLAQIFEPSTYEWVSKKLKKQLSENEEVIQQIIHETLSSAMSYTVTIFTRFKIICILKWKNDPLFIEVSTLFLEYIVRYTLPDDRMKFVNNDTFEKIFLPEMGTEKFLDLIKSFIESAKKANTNTYIKQYNSIKLKELQSLVDEKSIDTSFQLALETIKYIIAHTDNDNLLLPRWFYICCEIIIEKSDSIDNENTIKKKLSYLSQLLLLKQNLMIFFQNISDSDYLFVWADEEYADTEACSYTGLSDDNLWYKSSAEDLCIFENEIRKLLQKAEHFNISVSDNLLKTINQSKEVFNEQKK